MLKKIPRIETQNEENPNIIHVPQKYTDKDGNENIAQVMITKNQHNLIGCNQKQVDKVFELLIKGKRYFGSSAASLTHQIGNPAYKKKDEQQINPKLAQVGLEGERKTTLLLKDWIEKHPGAVLVDSVHIKGYGTEEYNEETGLYDGGDTDHILIIGSIVLIIDSKNWKKGIYKFNENQEIVRASGSFPGSQVPAVKASRLWYSYLKDHNIQLSALVCLTNDKTSVIRDVNWWKQPFRLVTLETLEYILNLAYDKYGDGSKHRINANLVASIVANTIQPFDAVKHHLEEVSWLLRGK